MSDPIDDIITDEILKEGGAAATNDPLDAGGRTQFGISETSNPEAWVDGVVSEAEARDIYFRKYVKGPGFGDIKDVPLMHQLVDFSVLSGAAVAIRKLQKVVGVHEDGILGPATLAAVAARDARTVNNALMVERIMMLATIVAKTPSQARFLVGWLSRTTSFIR